MTKFHMFAGGPMSASQIHGDWHDAKDYGNQHAERLAREAALPDSQRATLALLQVGADLKHDLEQAGRLKRLPADECRRMAMRLRRAASHTTTLSRRLEADKEREAARRLALRYREAADKCMRRADDLKRKARSRTGKSAPPTAQPANNVPPAFSIDE